MLRAYLREIAQLLEDTFVIAIIAATAILAGWICISPDTLYAAIFL